MNALCYYFGCGVRDVSQTGKDRNSLWNIYLHFVVAQEFFIQMNSNFI